MFDAKPPLRRAVCALFALTPAFVHAQTCTGLCLQQITCPGNTTTSITGTVFAPNGVDPLPGVLVYVPNAPVPALPAGATCRVGGTPPTSPLLKTVTSYDGTFTLTNMPVGLNIPLVIQAGKWRRQLVIPNVAACVNTGLPTSGASQVRFPKNHSEGDIPRLAIVTGSTDAQECILRKIGIADTEFTSSTGAGRINLFSGAGSAGASVSGITSETILEASASALGAYDMVMFGCQGAAYAQTASAQQLLIDYTNAGGRVMATHYAYTWLYNAAPFSGTATWVPDGTPPFDDPAIASINSTFPEGFVLAQWLQYVGASTTQGQVQLSDLRNDTTGIVAPSLLWLNVNDSVQGFVPMLYTFDTPVGELPENQCGRVAFNDFHPEPQASSAGLVFPSECSVGATTPQEKLFEYMLFDLTNNPDAQLGLTIDDGRQFARSGIIANYTIKLVNNSSIAAKDVAITSTLSSGLDAANALCIGSGGANCTTSSAGGLPSTATLEANSTATWVINVPVLAGADDTTVEMDVSVPGVAPAKDIDTLVIFRDSFDVANGDGTQ